MDKLYLTVENGKIYLVNNLQFTELNLEDVVSLKLQLDMLVNSIFGQQSHAVNTSNSLPAENPKPSSENPEEDFVQLCINQMLDAANGVKKNNKG